ncbi:MAG: acyltransferase family protein [Bryobacteraceae bacterium]
MSQPATPPLESSPPAAPMPQRLVSLDAFRGATMALMVLVNNSGDWSHTYGPLRHSAWNGWTITDVVFPSFLWIVGVAITLSLGGRLARGVARSRLLLQALRRAAILYGLGALCSLLPSFDFGTMRLLGVLQRIAICYLIASAIYLYAPRIRTQILWIVSLLAGYWLIMTLIPVPGYGAGRLDMQGNLAHYVDRIVLGAHNYAPTKTWDPEGIVSTLPAIATALFGVLAGHLLRPARGLDWKTTRLFFIGNALIGLGLICDIWLPINKQLWTSSFALFMAGLDFVLLAGFIYLIDDLGYKRIVQPFVVFGMNAIAIYMLSELLAIALMSIHWHAAAGTISLQSWLFDHCFAPLASPYNAALVWALAFVAVMYLAAYALYRRKWFIRV